MYESPIDNTVGWLGNWVLIILANNAFYPGDKLYPTTLLHKANINAKC